MNRSRMGPNKDAGDPVSVKIIRLPLGSLNACVQKAPGEGLSGWAGIEDHLTTHDSGEMEDNSDDIDTMLVFVRSLILSTQVY